MIINCNEISVEATRLRSIFRKCYNLKPMDLRAIVTLIESVNSCAGGNFNLKTINGESIIGVGNIEIKAGSDGTKLVQGTGITISGNGSTPNPYRISSIPQVVDGSETKLVQGSNNVITGTGTATSPYVINTVIPSQTPQVNADWNALSGPSLILNKPPIQTNLGTNLSYLPSFSNGTISSSTGASATIPLASQSSAGLFNFEMIENLANVDNIKIEKVLPIPTDVSNLGFVNAINQLPSFEVNDKQILTFKSIRSIGDITYMYYVEFLNTGKGVYGVGGKQLSLNDIKITVNQLGLVDLDSSRNTQYVDLGTKNVSVHTALNQSSLLYDIQEQSKGFVVVKGFFELGEAKEYLFVGSGGVYGLGQKQSVESDFKRINSELVINHNDTKNLNTGEYLHLNSQEKTFFKKLGSVIENKSGISVTGNTLTIDAGWSWFINFNSHANVSSSTFNIPFSSAGTTRVDLLVAGTGNSFQVVSGQESASATLDPAITINTVLVSRILVNSSSISIPTSGGSGINSVTGDLVDNTNVKNPIINTPSLQEVLEKNNNTTKPIIINGAGFYSKDGGIEIGESNTGNTGSNHVAIGVVTGQNNTGAYQIAIGHLNGVSNRGFAQISLGTYAGSDNTGANQVAIGTGAGAGNIFDNTILLGTGANATAANQFSLGATNGTKNVRFDCDVLDDLLLQFPLTSGRLALEGVAPSLQAVLDSSNTANKSIVLSGKNGSNTIGAFGMEISNSNGSGGVFNNELISLVSSTTGGNINTSLTTTELKIGSPGNSSPIFSTLNSQDLTLSTLDGGTNKITIAPSTAGNNFTSTLPAKSGIVAHISDTTSPVSATVVGVVNNVSLQELGGSDKLINGIRIGKGNGSLTGNTALGLNTLNAISVGVSNTAVGSNSQKATTEGTDNSSFGNDALLGNTKGSYNDAFGSGALQSNTEGTQNLAFGGFALNANTKGNYNLAIGTSALQANVLGLGNTIAGNGGGILVTGNYNTGFGYNALSKTTTGANNVALGSSAGRSITTGSDNILIQARGLGNTVGVNTGSKNIVMTAGTSDKGVTSGSSNVIIGGVTGLAQTDSNLVILSDGDGNVAFRKNTNGEVVSPNLTVALVKSGGVKSLVTKEYLESRIVTNATTTVLSKATLDATYPSETIGFKVHALSIITGGLIYEKTSAGWCQTSVTNVV